MSAALLIALLSPPVAGAVEGHALVLKSVSVEARSVTAGKHLKVGYTVRNRDRRRLHHRLAGVRLIGFGGLSDIRLKPGPRQAVAARKRVTRSARLEVPAAAPSGRYRLRVCARRCVAARDSIRVLPRPECRRRLAHRGVGFRGAPSQPGVADPVTVDLPINGISYFARDARRPDGSLFMDCSLALALHAMAESLEAEGITAVEHLGIYAYRCIAGTYPCELSQHARATAIDLHEFRTADGRAYNVETDWRTGPGNAGTCSRPGRGKGDRVLHRLACGWHESRLFNIVLTPDFNADHRDHLHVDLTPQADFIR